MSRIVAQLARAAVDNPSAAPALARVIGQQLRAERDHGPGVPPGYIYHGAHTWIFEANGLEVEPLPTDDPNAPPLTSSRNAAIPIRASFDAFIFGAAGWAAAVAPLDNDEPPSLEQIALSALLTTAKDGRDLFSLELGHDGKETWETTGREQVMLPATQVVGTRDSPRDFFYLVQRNQILQARFRNYCNVIAADYPEPFPVVNARVAYYVLNLEMP